MNLIKLSADIARKAEWNRMRNYLLFFLCLLASLFCFWMENSEPGRQYEEIGYLCLLCAAVVLFIWGKEDREWKRSAYLVEQQRLIQNEIERRASNE